jgi:uncharacterized protein
MRLPGLRMYYPVMVITEACYVLERDLGPIAESQFLESLEGARCIGPSGDDWRRISELVRQYADFPLGGADASVVTLAERLGTDIVLTLDRRHFGAVRPAHCESLRLLPD